MDTAFYAMVSRLRLINRWALMRNTFNENVMEHSFQVAVIAHALALIRQKYFAEGRPPVEARDVLAFALFHDASEIITGDMPTPIKYATPEMRRVYGEAETEASLRLLRMLPEDLRTDYAPLLGAEGAICEEEAQTSEEKARIIAIRELVKAADRVTAYLKCVEETSLGNREFAQAREQCRKKLDESPLPELHYFLKHFGSSFSLSLDQLQREEIMADKAPTREVTK